MFCASPILMEKQENEQPGRDSKMEKKLSIKTVYAACLLSGALTVYSGIQSFKPRPVSKEYLTVRSDLSDIKDDLNKPAFYGFSFYYMRQLGEYTEEHYIRPVIQNQIERAKKLLSEERSLEDKLNLIKKNPDYKKESISEITMGLLLIASGVAFGLSSLITGLYAYSRWEKRKEKRDGLR